MIKNTKTDLPSTQYWKIKLNKNIILKDKIERKNFKTKEVKKPKEKKIILNNEIKKNKR
jgi:hypothetical protein